MSQKKQVFEPHGGCTEKLVDMRYWGLLFCGECKECVVGVDAVSEVFWGSFGWC